MQLKDVRPNSRIEVGKLNELKEELTFKFLTGKGSYCTKDNGDMVNIPGDTEVTVIQVY